VPGYEYFVSLTVYWFIWGFSFDHVVCNRKESC